MGRIRRSCGDKDSESESYEKNKRGAWSVGEDEILINCIQIHGIGKWAKVSKLTGLKRSGKSCRLRWLNYLRPDIKRGNISRDEEDLIIRLHKLLGNRWSLIAGRIPGRTDNEIKNYWNTTLRKKVGINVKEGVEKRSNTTSNESSTYGSEEYLSPNDITSSWDDFINFSAILQDCPDHDPNHKLCPHPSPFCSTTSGPNWFSQDNSWLT